MPGEPTPTLIQDLEAAADVLRLREANDIQPPLDSTLGKRLRAAAARLREEMERARGTLCDGWLERINGAGPATPSKGEPADEPEPGSPMAIARAESIARYVGGAAPAAPVEKRCAEWCGGEAPDDTPGCAIWYGYKDAEEFCTPACRDAGRPCHPMGK